MSHGRILAFANIIGGAEEQNTKKVKEMGTHSRI